MIETTIEGYIVRHAHKTSEGTVSAEGIEAARNFGSELREKYPDKVFVGVASTTGKTDTYMGRAVETLATILGAANELASDSESIDASLLGEPQLDLPYDKDDVTRVVGYAKEHTTSLFDGALAESEEKTIDVACAYALAADNRFKKSSSDSVEICVGNSPGVEAFTYFLMLGAGMDSERAMSAKELEGVHVAYNISNDIYTVTPEFLGASSFVIESGSLHQAVQLGVERYQQENSIKQREDYTARPADGMVE